MYYTLKEICRMSGMTEHTIRYYTDKKLLPCERDGANRRIFDEDSLGWLRTIQCLKGCGMSIEDIRHYCELCRMEESEENLRARYEIILEYRKRAREKLEEAQKRVEYMERKTKHYEAILSGQIPDDMNPHAQHNTGASPVENAGTHQASHDAHPEKQNKGDTVQ